MIPMLIKDDEGKREEQYLPEESRRLVRADGGAFLYWPRSCPSEQGGTVALRYVWHLLIDERN